MRVFHPEWSLQGQEWRAGCDRGGRQELAFLQVLLFDSEEILFHLVSSRYSTGWRCGLHADWTELTGCVDNYLSGLEPEVGERRYFYITFLRYRGTSLYKILCSFGQGPGAEVLE